MAENHTIYPLTNAQRDAVNPESSVWVTANAGTGKTKVLTDRVLRLLLQGTLPDRILCLTFTKAAAAEMLTRVQDSLANWVHYPEKTLRAALENLTSHPPTDEQLTRARQLFLSVLDAPEGLKIMTIHSLCQSLLKRFALEAQLSPHFRLMDDGQTRQVQSQARALLLGDKDDRLSAAVSKLAAQLNAEDFGKLLDEIIGKRSHFEHRLKQPEGLQQMRAQIAENLELPSDQSASDLLEARLHHINENAGKYEGVVSAFDATGTEPEKREKARPIKQILCDLRNASRMSEMEKNDCWKRWSLIYLTKTEQTPRARMCTDKVKKAYPHINEMLIEEQQRVHATHLALCAHAANDWTQAVLTIAQAYLRHYHRLKTQRGLMDYDDLIGQTYQLLNREGIAPWILFKLDSQIEHLMVDEAQDTNPLQWQIIRLLADDFFSGDSAQTSKRTLFVVGDEKQSIYRFQGADPQKFSEMKQYFSHKIGQANQHYQDVSLSLSFRSTPAVLKAVDAVFKNPNARDGVGDIDREISHAPNRSNEAGRVELWPCIISENNDAEDSANGDGSGDSDDSISTSQKLMSKQLTETIAGWLKNKRPLPARNRPVEAGDILILVRSRTPFFFTLIRNLKRAGIPVAGEDRLKLLEQLCVRDLLALADFLLKPSDDLALACLLKSPLFDVDEDQLFHLCYGREGTVWARLQQMQPAIADILRHWLGQTDFTRPYELFAQILEAEGYRSKFAARLGVEVHDPLNEFLNLARAYENSAPASLQGFVHDIRQGELTIKREQEQRGDQLRVMTVHGSKGLQSPIVILTDTTSVPSNKSKLMWEGDVCYYTPNEAKDAPAIIALKEAYKQSDAQEYRRLLYVAMTRAADELYVGGWLNQKANSDKVPTANDESWYALIEQGMKKCAAEDGAGNWVLADAVIEREKQKSKAVATPEITTLPAWFNQPMPQEPSPPKPMQPSRAYEPETAEIIPFTDAALRGNVIHKLLETLPDIAENQREIMAKLMVEKLAAEVDESTQAKWIAESLAVLNHPEFKAIFSENSFAETPITAMIEVDDKQPYLLSGQIDRLVVGDNEVLVVDYKTSRYTSKTQGEIPKAYLAQMNAYKQALTPLYPSHKIRAALLYTHEPKLIVLD